MKKYLMFALLGYTVGTLYAPKKGSLLRKEIRDRADDMQRNGTEALREMQQKSQEITGKATVVFDKAKVKARALQCGGDKLIQSASEKLQEAYIKCQSALHLVTATEEGKSTRVVAQRKEQAKEPNNRVKEFFVARDNDRIAEQMAERESKCL